MPSIPESERKLREARFFLERMRERAVTYVGDPEEFRYYLSAFLAAAASTEDILGKELSKSKRVLQDCYWKLSLEDSWCLCDLREHRNDELHREGDYVRSEFRDVPVSDAPRDRRHPAYGMHDFSPPGTPATTIRGVFWYLDAGGQREPVLEPCEGILGALDRLVSHVRSASGPLSP